VIDLTRCKRIAGVLLLAVPFAGIVIYKDLWHELLIVGAVAVWVLTILWLLGIWD
jgi:hypothetical protein